MTTPFYFGQSERRLYGVFHHPEKPAMNAPAVLLLNPFGEEAIRAYRIFKQLANRLARDGAARQRGGIEGRRIHSGQASSR